MITKGRYMAQNPKTMPAQLQNFFPKISIKNVKSRVWRYIAKNTITMLAHIQKFFPKVSITNVVK